MKKLFKIISLSLILLSGGCVEQISFPLERTDRERLIVSGRITDLEGPHTVFLSETTSNARQPLLAEQLPACLLVVTQGVGTVACAISK